MGEENRDTERDSGEKKRLKSSSIAVMTDTEERERYSCFLWCIPIVFGHSCKTVDMTFMPKKHIELN